MRELKIRIWDNLFKEFKALDNYFCKAKDGILTVCTNNDDIMLDLPTGLKDKNGKEIYEGDIVDYNDDGECIGIVKYDAPEFYLDADATNWARMFLKGAPHQKVIGNVHENPELLESEQ